MFSAASKTWFTAAPLAIAAGFLYAVASSDRNGLSALVFAGVGLALLGIGAWLYAPKDVAPTTREAETEDIGVDPTDVPRPSAWPVLAAVTLGVFAVGAALGSSLVWMGFVFAVIAAFAWFGQAWREHPSWTEAMTARLNDRFVVPFGLPAMIIVLAGIGVISFSRVLLAVPKEAATIIALVVAAAMLGAAFVISTQERIGRAAMTTLSVFAVALVLGSGIVGALQGEREFEHHGAEGGEVRIVADDLVFDLEELDLPAQTEVRLVLENEDTAQHNVSIYAEQGGDDIFVGEIIDGGKSITYEFTTPEPGTYYFQCDVHPNMNGEVVVAVAASEEPEPGTNATTTSAPEH